MFRLFFTKPKAVVTPTPPQEDPALAIGEVYGAAVAVRDMQSNPDVRWRSCASGHIFRWNGKKYTFEFLGHVTGNWIETGDPYSTPYRKLPDNFEAWSV